MALVACSKACSKACSISFSNCSLLKVITVSKATVKIGSDGFMFFCDFFPFFCTFPFEALVGVWVGVRVGVRVPFKAFSFFPLFGDLALAFKPRSFSFMTCW